MKKIIVLILALTLLLSLVACGDKTPNGDDPLHRDDETTGGNTPGNIDIGSILAGNGSSSVIWANTDSAYKDEFIRQAEEEGMTVSFGNDGSTTLTDEDGNKLVQKPDGTWVFESDNGEQIDVGSGKWPDNEFTRILPKPSMAINTTYVEDSGFSVIFAEGATKDAVKAYEAQLKSKGFTIDPEAFDQAMMGMVMYTYSASNSAGYRVELSFVSGTATLSVSK